MKKLLIIINLITTYMLTPAATTPVTGNTIPKNLSATKPISYETSSYSFDTFFIHNLGNKPVTLNSISVLFSIGAADPQPQKLTYKKVIKPGKIGKITNAKIKFIEPVGTQINYSGISEININNNQIIKISKSNYDIYLTNQGNVWKETSQPKAVKATAKNITTQISPAPKINESSAKSTTVAAKTSTLKAATIAIKNKTKITQPQSKTAKAINIATKPKSVIIKPETL